MKLLLDNENYIDTNLFTLKHCNTPCSENLYFLSIPKHPIHSCNNKNCLSFRTTIPKYCSGHQPTKESSVVSSSSKKTSSQNYASLLCLKPPSSHTIRIKTMRLYSFLLRQNTRGTSLVNKLGFTLTTSILSYFGGPFTKVLSLSSLQASESWILSSNCSLLPSSPATYSPPYSFHPDVTIFSLFSYKSFLYNTLSSPTILVYLPMASFHPFSLISPCQPWVCSIYSYICNKHIFNLIKNKSKKLERKSARVTNSTFVLLYFLLLYMPSIANVFTLGIFSLSSHSSTVYVP